MVPPYTAWRRLIERYLNRELSLELNPRERLRPVSDGVDFLGDIVRRDDRLVRRRVVAALKARLRGRFAFNAIGSVAHFASSRRTSRSSRMMRSAASS
jgi:hypothetical protein